MSKWIDLVDPDDAELRKQTPKRLHARALDRLLAPAQHEDEPRPTLEGHGDYVFGVFLVPVAVPDENRVYYQEIDLVLTRELVLTARKTPPGARSRSTRRASTKPARVVASTNRAWSRTTLWTRSPSITSI
jgi:Mg2+ and Co2+ transporter CorA